MSSLTPAQQALVDRLLKDSCIFECAIDVKEGYQEMIKYKIKRLINSGGEGAVFVASTINQDFPALHGIKFPVKVFFETTNYRRVLHHVAMETKLMFLNETSSLINEVLAVNFTHNAGIHVLQVNLHDCSLLRAIQRMQGLSPSMKTLFLSLIVPRVGSLLLRMLKWLDEKNIRHLDIKPHNILINGIEKSATLSFADSYPRIQLSDFGHALVLEACHTLQLPFVRGTSGFRALELEEGTVFSSSDYFSVRQSILALHCYDSNIIGDEREHERLSLFLEQHVPYLDSLAVLDPAERPSISQLLGMDMYQGCSDEQLVFEIVTLIKEGIDVSKDTNLRVTSTDLNGLVAAAAVAATRAPQDPGKRVRFYTGISKLSFCPSEFQLQQSRRAQRFEKTTGSSQADPGLTATTRNRANSNGHYHSNLQRLGHVLGGNPDADAPRKSSLLESQDSAKAPPALSHVSQQQIKGTAGTKPRKRGPRRVHSNASTLEEKPRIDRAASGLDSGAHLGHEDVSVVPKSQQEKEAPPTPSADEEVANRGIEEKIRELYVNIVGQRRGVNKNQELNIIGSFSITTDAWNKALQKVEEIGTASSSDAVLIGTYFYVKSVIPSAEASYLHYLVYELQSFARPPRGVPWKVDKPYRKTKVDILLSRVRS
eukprot:TRINITY_DN2910_c0_g1_i1.p1 TRINITY_DN2910_c0_g1~~TRINITY_DN2910_c0_g1_i1.p1  ORF type:complete len:654 (-),score=93.01 TRINITY_DN2910_c0_g1_i1:290-2251(-)